MPEPTANTESGEGAVIGVSPTRLVMRRFLRHKLAVAGTLCVVIMSLAVVAGPWLLPHDPGLIRSWLRELAPGAQVPEALNVNILSTDETPVVPDSWRQAGVVTVIARTVHATDYRVVVRRGVISSIAHDTGGVALDSLALDGPYEAVQELLEDGVRDLPRATLTVGHPPPPGVLADGKSVILIRAVDAILEQSVVATFAGSQLKSLTVNGTSADAIEMNGSDITRVTDAAGRELTLRFWLGTDQMGRDLLTRLLYGGRISLMVGIVATLVSLLIGVIYGAVAGYVGGRSDRLMMGVVDVLYAVPFMFIVIVLMSLVGRNIVMLFVALGAVQWLTMSRIVRGQVLSLREQEFVAAARLSGCRPWTIITRHLLPHTIGPVVVYTSLTVPAVILEESFLAFIGMGVQWQGTDLSSWGRLVVDGIQALGDGGERAWLFIAPATALAVTLFGLNALGDGLRDAFDPKHAKV